MIFTLDLDGSLGKRGFAPGFLNRRLILMTDEIIDPYHKILDAMAEA
jgi:hypothetical protein